MRTKSEERRLHILREAAATFAELGVETTTMSEIVSRLGGSKATVYSDFPSKDESVQQVLAQQAELKLQQSLAALDTVRPVADSLRHFGRAYLVQLLTPEMLSALRIAQQNAHRGENGMQFYEVGPKVSWTMMQKFLEHHVEAGTLHPCNRWVAAMHLKGLLQGELLDRAMFGEKIAAVHTITRLPTAPSTSFSGLTARRDDMAAMPPDDGIAPAKSMTPACSTRCRAAACGQQAQ